MAHVLGISRTQVRMRLEHDIQPEDQEKFNSLMMRRMQGEPLAYILGEKEFWSLPLQVNPHVLIPRPETEILVEAVLKKLPNKAGIRILDLGTGSGAIALALAVERPKWHVVATDKSTKALDVALQNAKRLSLKNITFLCGDWFDAILKYTENNRVFDAIVSNPPYVSSQEFTHYYNQLKFEPQQALIAEEDGLADLKHIISEASSFLVSKGWLFLEHGYDQAKQILFFLQKCGFIEIQDLKDLADVNRVSIGRKC